MAGFVVCASCGTQIKAGRAYCLRCGEDLPVEGAPVKISVWESLQLSQTKLLILLGVVALIVMALVVVIWQTQPGPGDEMTLPVSTPDTPPRDVPPPGADNAAPAGPADPASAAFHGALTAQGGSRTIDSSRYS